MFNDYAPVPVEQKGYTFAYFSYSCWANLLVSSFKITLQKKNTFELAWETPIVQFNYILGDKHKEDALIIIFP
jgi:hypothetical protein